MTSAVTGVRHPHHAGHWLVPPWRPDADVCEVLAHFMRFEPWHVTEATTANLTAYYVGLVRALDGAATVEARYVTDGQWLDAVRTAARRCAATCRGQDVAGRPGQATTP